MRLKSKQQHFILLLLILLSPMLSAQVRLFQISSSGDFIGGPNASGQMGDYRFENDVIAGIVSNLNHPSQYTNTGGHVIDAALINGNNDQFNCLFTYFNNTFPNQANYNQISIINDGSNGEKAVLRVAGVYSQNNQVTVFTEYSLDEGDLYVTVQTWLVNNSSSPISNFGLGDAVQWGGTVHFAPGYGFNISGITTTEEWLAGKGDDVSYGYTKPSGNLTGPNGASWSDPVSFNANIPVDDTATYIRYLTIGSGDIASAVDAIYQIRGVSTGIIAGQVIDSDTQQGLAGVTIDINSDYLSPYTQIITDQNGNFPRHLPQGNYHLTLTKTGYSSLQTNTTIVNDQTTELYLELDSGGGGGYPVADTISYILRPLPNIPSIVRRDDTFSIELDADQATGNWQVKLLFQELTFTIPIDFSYFDSGLQRWFLQASVPDDMPIELYDLWITADNLADTVENAVKVIDEYKSDFYFIQITDTHLPSSIYYDEPGGLTDTSSMSDLWTLIEDFKTINPEFVLHTGDLVNEGELEDYLEFRTFSRAKNLMANFTIPVFMGPGNHDLGGWDDTPPSDGTSRRDWWKFFGWKYLDQTSGPGPFTQDYYFDYDDIRFIELEAYDNYDSWRYTIYGATSFIDGQIAWLNDIISSTDPSKTIVLFNHYDFQSELNIAALGIDMNLYGHIHYDDGSIYTYPYNLATDNVCDGDRSFRIVHYDSMGLHPQLTFHAGSSGQNLSVNYMPANDGQHDTVTAVIANNYAYTFSDGQIVFKMPHADGFIINNGELWQTIELDSFDLCYVKIPLANNSVTAVTIAVDTSAAFIPGDANGDGEVLSSDVTYLIGFFRGLNPAPVPWLAGDCNGDCLVIGSDVTYLVRYFSGTGNPPVRGDCD